MLAAVIPAIINGTTCPKPKEVKKTIPANGLPVCAIQLSKTAKTGVVHGDDARPKAIPAEKGAKGSGTLVLQISGSGPMGKGILRIPRRLSPINTASTAVKVGKNNGTCPYTFPKMPLILPSITRERTIPLQKLRLRTNGL